jgi:hypothetical protein
MAEISLVDLVKLNDADLTRYLDSLSLDEAKDIFKRLEDKIKVEGAFRGKAADLIESAASVDTGPKSSGFKVPFTPIHIGADTSSAYDRAYDRLRVIHKRLADKIKELTLKDKENTNSATSGTAYRALRPFNANTMWKQYFGSIPNPPATKKDVRSILDLLVSKKDDVYAEDMAEYVLQNLDEGGAWYNALIGAKNGAK